MRFFLSAWGEMRFFVGLCQGEPPASWSDFHVPPGDSLQTLWSQAIEREISGQYRTGHTWMHSSWCWADYLWFRWPACGHIRNLTSAHSCSHWFSRTPWFLLTLLKIPLIFDGSTKASDSPSLSKAGQVCSAPGLSQGVEIKAMEVL